MRFLTLSVLLVTAISFGFAQTGAISGRVLFKGTAPKPKEISASAMKAADAKCADLHKGKGVTTEEVVVNPNGTLRWVLVWVKEGVKGTFPSPSKEVVLDQVGCIFRPHVIAVQVGQPVVFLNSDPLLHNVRTQSKKGNSFNIAQPLKGSKQARKFRNPEIGIPIRCDVHFWMVAYLHIIPHPFFAVTGKDGSFTIAGLKPGTYTVEAWHEKLGTQTQKVTVPPTGTAKVEFVFAAK
ncbi:MAG: carboxypeptidase regulatory-like domain-containing protein [Armatimonadetes bacterium]|nr:carboxypeptidase regulatory-like domain-containing protein [Armatimonadota bacterium]MDW8121707.1 carboxypeptidase regulatory-like domain-containing protein [Armatimonadota bacterium]